MDIGHRKEISFDEIILAENLLRAWCEFRAGKRSKKDVLVFERNIEDHIFRLQWELANGRYQHGPYRSFVIHDPKRRDIHKALVRDRVIHHAVFRILCPYFDRTFINDSYSCRTNKGSHRAILRLKTFLQNTSRNNRIPCFALKCDIRRFFASMDHEVLLGILQARIADERIVQLLRIIINSFPEAPQERERERVNRRAVGLPIGNLTSQLFANLYLNELDVFVKHTLKIRYYARYSDDLVIVHSDRKYLENLIPTLKEFTEKKLRLELHPKKVIIRKFSQGIDFLGYVLLPHAIVMRTKTKRRMFRLLGEKLKLLANVEISKKSFHQTVQSYLGILKHCKGRKVKRMMKDLWNYLL